LQDSEPFEREPQTIDILKVCPRKSRHAGAAMPTHQHKAFALKLYECLADWATADFEHASKLLFAEGLPRLKPALEYGVAQPIDHIVCQTTLYGRR
jgi:hypothetical protein